MRHRTLHLPARLAAAIAATLCLVSATARAEVGLAVHAEGVVARMVTQPKSDQLGWGGGGALAFEVALNRVVGVDLPIGVVGLAAREVQPTALMRATASTGVFTTPGLRLRPLGALDSRWARALWIAGGAGVSITGAAPYPALSVRAGVDVPIGRVAIGPHAGFLHIIDPGGGLHEDARVVTAGIHGVLELRPPKAAPRDPPRPEPQPAAAVEPDRDGPAEAVETEIPPAPQPPPDRSGETLSDARIQFSVGDATVSDEALELLARVAFHLSAHPGEVHLSGHADDVGPADYNLALSEKRARAVAEALAGLGVEAARVRVSFHGSKQPRRAERTPEARRENRRVEITVPADGTKEGSR